MLLSVEVHFEAAHQLHGLPASHKCARVHGHNYRAIITVAGPSHPVTGMVVDAAALLGLIGANAESRAFTPLDHQFLNGLADWNGWMAEQPTAERIAEALFSHAEREIDKTRQPFRLETVQVFETEWLSATCGRRA